MCRIPLQIKTSGYGLLVMVNLLHFRILGMEHSNTVLGMRMTRFLTGLLKMVHFAK